MRTSYGVAVLVAAASCSSEPTGLQGTGRLVAEPSTLDLGSVLAGSTARAVVRVQNQGRRAGSLVARAPDGFAALVPEEPLGPGAIVPVPIQFRRNQGDASGEIRFSIEGVGSATVAVRAAAVHPELVLPAALDLGAVRLGGRASLPLEIANPSTVVVPLALQLDGPDAAEFGLSASGVSLPGGGTARVMVSFSPASSGTRFASLSLRACPACDRQQVPLAGTGARVVAAVRPSAIDFGFVPVGSASSREVTVTSTGEVPAWLAGARLVVGPGSPFSLDGPPAPTQVGHGGVPLVISFAPGAERAYQGALRLEVGGEVVEVAIQGAGGEGAVRFEPEGIDFGLWPVGASGVRTVRLSAAPGVTSAALDQVRIDGDEGLQFGARLMAEPPLELGAADVEVTLVASRAGSFEGRLVAVSGDGEQTIPVRAIVIDGPECNLTFEPVLRLGLVTVGRSLEREILLHNAGGGPCTVDSLAAGGEGFSVVEPDAGLQEIPAAGSLSVRVAYAPSRTSLFREEGEVSFRQTSRTVPMRSFRVLGTGTLLDVRATPDPAIFEPSPSGASALLAIDLWNAGTIPVFLDHTAASGGVIEIRSGPAAIPPLGHASLHLAHGLLSASESAQLEVWPIGEPDAVRIPVRADLRAGGCGASCLAPLVSCPRDLSQWWPRRHLLDGAALSPPGLPISCAWSITSAPAGASPELLPFKSCGSLLAADRAGGYALRLEARDSNDNFASCTTQVEAGPFEGVWIETTHDAPEGIDLHIFEGNADLSDAAAWREETHCWRGSPRPAWGREGPEDDPGHESASDGLEAVWIPAPAAGTAFVVGHHWARTDFLTDRVPLTTTIVCGGARIARLSTELDRPYLASELGTIVVEPGSGCVFTSGTRGTEVLP